MNPRLAIHRNRIPDGQNRSVIKRNLMLTAGGVRAIITAGRDDASVRLLPSDCNSKSKAVTSWRWMAALLYFFFFLSLSSRPNLIAFKTREMTIMTTEIISKSDMIPPPSTFVFRGEKPSAICFLPAGSPKASQIFYHNGTHTSNYVL